MHKLNRIDEFEYITFPSLEKHENLFHCFTTRLGGVSEGCYQSMNLGMSTDDDRENKLKNYEILSEKLCFDLNDMVKTSQSHTANIRYATESDKGKIFNGYPGYADVDGLITDRKNIVISTSHADCTPIFFYDPIKEVIGMVHAGWRGTVENITGNMIKRFTEDFGSIPENIEAAIGPSLGQCCFEVDEDVAEIFLKADKNYETYMKKIGNKYNFDLWEINKYIMMNNGMREENIEIAGICTKCRNDLFFSHRGQKGKRGLMLGMIMMK